VAEQQIPKFRLQWHISRRIHRFGLVAVAAVLLSGRVASAAIITVTTTAQSGPGCTISDAITAANLDLASGDCPAGSLGQDIIRVPAGTYTLTTPAVDEPYWGATGFPYITSSLVIEGHGAAGTVIVRDPDAPKFRLFRTLWQRGPVPIHVEFRDLTLRGGATSPSARGAGGGALLFDNHSLVARRVVFDGNESLQGEAYSAHNGGAIADSPRYNDHGARLTIEDSVFAGNRAWYAGGAIFISPGATLVVRNSRFVDNSAYTGGAIQAVFDPPVLVDVADSEFLRNTATAYGGAIESWSTLLTRVTFRDNRADRGGAVSSYSLTTIVDSAFDGNQAYRAGAVEILGQALISGSTFSANQATGEDGGALYLDERSGVSRISNSTFSGNRTVRHGGAISLRTGQLALNNVTVTGNTAAYGGGVATAWGNDNPNLRLRLANSIVAANTTGGGPVDLEVGSPSFLVSLGSNLIGSGAGSHGVFVSPGDRVGTAEAPLDAGLLPLAANGGLTLTHALAPGSLALDAGSTATAGTAEACEPTDQRGRSRPGAANTACDIGAFEHQVTVPLSLVVGPRGSVVGLDGTTACRGTCDAAFSSGAVVRLEAQPDSGALFVGWLGACTGSALTCTVTMDRAQMVTATFRNESAVSTTTVSSSANPSVNGQIIEFTAVVTSSDDAVPTGSVTFVNVTNGTVLDTAPLDVTGTARVSHPLGVGPQVFTEIKAIYTGDGTFTASSGTVLQAVHRAISAVALSASVLRSVAGQPVTFTAVVSAVAPGTGIPDGNLLFRNASMDVTLGTMTLDASGSATITSALSVGVQQIQAVYLGRTGTPHFEQSSIAIIQIVTVGSTTTVLSADANPSLSGRPVIFTARVAAVAPATGTPTGAVGFVDGTTGAALGTVTLNASGYAILEIALAEGARTVVATYLADGAFAASSGSVSHVTLPTTVSLNITESLTVDDESALTPQALNPATITQVTSPG